MIMQRTSVNQKVYDKLMDVNKWKDDDGFIPQDVLCCCEYRRTEHEEGLHVAQHCMECSEVDSIMEDLLCKCKIDLNRCFEAIQSKSILPFPGGAHIIPLDVWCVVCPLFLICLFVSKFIILSIIFGTLFLCCCLLPYTFMTKKRKQISKKTDNANDDSNV